MKLSVSVESVGKCTIEFEQDLTDAQKCIIKSAMFLPLISLKLANNKETADIIKNAIEAFEDQDKQVLV